MNLATTFIVLLLTAATPAYGGSIANGDSLAVGFGQASRVTTIARVGASSCEVLGMIPSAHYDSVLLSAGTNDPPGRCIEAIRAKMNASHIKWVAPVNSARSHVLQVAAGYGDTLLYYTPGDGRTWPRPSRYWNVLSWPGE